MTMKHCIIVIYIVYIVNCKLSNQEICVQSQKTQNYNTRSISIIIILYTLSVYCQYYEILVKV